MRRDKFRRGINLLVSLSLLRVMKVTALVLNLLSILCIECYLHHTPKAYHCALIGSKSLLSKNTYKNRCYRDFM
jgi:hypothetical protein